MTYYVSSVGSCQKSEGAHGKGEHHKIHKIQHFDKHEKTDFILSYQVRWQKLSVRCDIERKGNKRTMMMKSLSRRRQQQHQHVHHFLIAAIFLVMGEFIPRTAGLYVSYETPIEYKEGDEYDLSCGIHKWTLYVFAPRDDASFFLPVLSLFLSYHYSTMIQTVFH